jgi:hypothetical protein
MIYLPKDGVYVVNYLFVILCLDVFSGIVQAKNNFSHIIYQIDM